MFHSLRIARVVDETPDARSFVLEVPPALEKTFAYRAGQFLTFRVPCQGDALLRCYSLASAPETDRELKVTVKRVEAGRASNWLNDRLHAGDPIEVLPPSGAFVLRPDARPIVFFAGGSGITPVISLIKSALVTTARRLTLVYANRDAASVIFRDELDALARRHPDRLEVIHRLDAAEGFLDAAAARALVAGSEDACFYLCGPAAFMDVVEAGIAAAGAARERIFVERFVSLHSHDELVAMAAAEPAASGAAGAADVPAEVEIRLGGRRVRAAYRAGDSVLETARRAGLDPPFACEEGYCGSCAARLLRGQVSMRHNDVFTPDEVAAGHILTCQARPQGAECEVSYDP
jgi:3-ketosteroid 9alpha-monooxygenase subunit B